jgi:hypothetical protein
MKHLCTIIFLSFALGTSAQIMTGEEEHMHHHEDAAMSYDSSITPMSHLYSLNLPMNRNGSGTGWQPDSSPMYGYMVHTRKWMMMFHGSIFLRYVKQDILGDGGRGDQAVSAPNWLMGMAQRKVGKKGLLAMNLMLSLDPLTEGGDGYPLLFQSGETWEGKALVDRQHPHDLFSALSVAYTQSFTKDIDLSLYAGFPGEPALGPTAFMHRSSSLNNPEAALGHHWSDATHITFGVSTFGFRYKWFKAEGSIFTGREPDELRYNFDKPLFDSYSYRLSFNPGCKRLSLQFSQGFLRSPEALEPTVNVTRTTASGTHTIQFKRKEEAWLSSTLAWGMNNHHNHHPIQHAVLLESNFQWGRGALYYRYEWVQKAPHDLNIKDPNHDPYNINAITLGSNVKILEVVNTSLALGVQMTLNISDNRLKPIYGNLPIAGQVYLHIMPAFMKMSNEQETIENEHVH